VGKINQQLNAQILFTISQARIQVQKITLSRFKNDERFACVYTTLQNSFIFDVLYLRI